MCKRKEKQAGVVINDLHFLMQVVALLKNL